MILFVSNSPFLGGAEHYLLDIIGLVKKDFKVKVACPAGLVADEALIFLIYVMFFGLAG